MAKLPALVSALAECDGRDRATLEHIARVIREAGYIPTTKRGAGAAEMTAREAANLFIGANGCDAPKDAPLAIDRFRSLVMHDAYVRDRTEVETFKQIAEASNFGVALEALIDGMGEVLGAAENWLRDGYKDRPNLVDGYYRSLVSKPWFGGFIPFHLDVRMDRYAAEISCRVAAADEHGTIEPNNNKRLEFRAKFLVDFNRLEEGFYGASHDRRVSVLVTGFSLLKLWSALQDKTFEANPTRSEDGELIL
jgi:hypothetical protein